MATEVPHCLIHYTNPHKRPAGVCQTKSCDKPATLQCPTCLQLKLPVARFCSQECFKAEWKEHNSIHKMEKDRLNHLPFPFEYTGSLRPAYVTPMRSVPEHIPKPDYALSGIPMSEQSIRNSSTIKVYSAKDIQGIREACRIGREVLDVAGRAIRVGITTDEIDLIVHEATIARGAYPSPLNYRDFPKSCCTSINEVICHGIPDLRPLQDGDIINIDISAYYKGYHADLNETYCVGNVDEASKKIIKTTYDALEQAISYVRPGTFFREFGDIISKHVEKNGLSVVRSYCGHGIGELFHCPPNIPHYAKNKAIGVCKPGMVFTIEPMINAGVWRDQLWLDDWTSVTQDGKRSAQFEHTILVTETGFEILTARTKDSPPLFWEVASPAASVASPAASVASPAASVASPTSVASPIAAPVSSQPTEAADADKKKKKKKKKKKTKSEDGKDEQDDEEDEKDETEEVGK